MEKRKIKVTCTVNSEHTTIFTVLLKDWNEWCLMPADKKRHIDQIFPYLDNEIKRMLLTGVCPTCYMTSLLLRNEHNV